jgi:hypothetical protein
MQDEAHILGLPIQDFHDRVDGVLRRLGWPKSQLCRSLEVSGNGGPLKLRHYFSIGEMDHPLYLQVNLEGEAHPLLAMVGVYAMRYRLCSGWHGVLLHESPDELVAEADAAACWVAGKHFDSAAARKAYRAAHPECSGWSWKRLRAEGGPLYEQSTCARRRLAARMA